MENNILAAAIPQEKTAPYHNGFAALLAVLIGLISSIACLVYSIILLERGVSLAGGVLLTVGILGICVLCIFFAGFKVLAPNQAYVFTLFGKYYGTLKSSGFYFVNPFVTANAPAGADEPIPAAPNNAAGAQITLSAGKSKKISLKTRTLDNRTQKVNDAMGNPIIIGSVVIWRVAVTLFSVDVCYCFICLY